MFLISQKPNQFFWGENTIEEHTNRYADSSTTQIQNRHCKQAEEEAKHLVRLQVFNSKHYYFCLLIQSEYSSKR